MIADAGVDYGQVLEGKITCTYGSHVKLNGML